MFSRRGLLASGTIGLALSFLPKFKEEKFFISSVFRTKYWYLGDLQSSVDFITYDGDNCQFLVKGALIHRLDGPAIERINGDKIWVFNGRQHRLEGPALEFENGYQEWWVHGIFQHSMANGVKCKDKQRHFYFHMR